MSAVRKATQTSSGNTRVCIIEDHGIVRAGIRMLIEKEQGIDVLCEATTASEALLAAHGCPLDVILLDMTSGKATNLTAVERVSFYNGGLHFYPGGTKRLGFTALIDVLRRMGADIEMTASGDRHGEPVGEVRARGGRRLRGAEVEAPEAASMIDELPLLAVAMAAAEGTSVVRGAGELRVKESDRIRATADGLRAIGASVEDLADGWRIERGSPRPATIEAAGDHRIAIAFGIAALAGVAASVELDDPDVVAVSDPTFWRALGEVST